MTKNEGLVWITVTLISSGRHKTPNACSSSNFACNMFALDEQYEGTFPFLGVGLVLPILTEARIKPDFSL